MRNNTKPPTQRRVVEHIKQQSDDSDWKSCSDTDDDDVEQQESEGNGPDIDFRKSGDYDENFTHPAISGVAEEVASEKMQQNVV